MRFTVRLVVALWLASLVVYRVMGYRKIGSA